MEFRLLRILCITSISLTTGTHLFADEKNSLLEDDLLLSDDSAFIPPTLEQRKPSWRDHFVTSLSHDQTRTDEGDTTYMRYAARVEYEQAFAKGWFTRIDIKGTSYRSLDKQALQRGQNKGKLSGESYQKVKLQQAWLQYSQGQCVHKLGQQTLIWGEVDGTFAIDDITPFDFTEQLLTDYSSIRLAQPMLVSTCFIKQQQAQIFYIPRAQLHLSSHNNDEYGLNAASGIDDEDLDSEWGARYELRMGKTELAFMFADLLANAPNQVLADLPPAPDTPPILLPIIADYKLYGLSANYSSGAWQLKYDLAYKTDQIVNGTLSETTDVIDTALGIEYLSPNNHSLNAGIWGTYALKDDIAPGQNDEMPFMTLRWSKSYLNDDLDMSLLASGRTKPESGSLTTQANYQYDDFWSFTGAITLADPDEDTVNPLQSENNELSLQIKYQF